MLQPRTAQKLNFTEQEEPSSPTLQPSSSREAFGNNNGRDQHHRAGAAATKDVTTAAHEGIRPSKQHQHRQGRRHYHSEKEQQEPVAEGHMERGRPAERYRGWGPGQRSPLAGSPQGHRKQRRLSAGAKQVREHEGA